MNVPAPVQLLHVEGVQARSKVSGPFPLSLARYLLLAGVPLCCWGEAARRTDGEQTELSRLAFKNIHTYVTFVLLPKEAWAHRDP